MPRRKLNVVMNDDTQEVEEVTPQESVELPFQLEQLNEEAMSQLKIWGNSTQMTIDKLAAVAPEWSRFLYEFFEMIKAHVLEHAE